MTHTDHVKLIRKGITPGNSTWADMGSGTGSFTLALRECAGEGVQIYSVDADVESLAVQKKAFAKQFPKTAIHYLHADFTYDLPLPPLDGIIAANSIHFTKDTVAVLKHFKTLLKPQGKLIIVEYNVDQGNPSVPYPFSFDRLQTLAPQAGFTTCEKIGSIPSVFLVEIYAALLYKAS